VIKARDRFDYPPNIPAGAWLEPAIKKSIGIDSITFVREARNARRAARLFSSALFT